MIFLQIFVVTLADVRIIEMSNVLRSHSFCVCVCVCVRHFSDGRIT